jgi:predicted glycosyltransferase
MSSVFFYVQHLLGIGHLRRAAIIARALSRHRLDVVFVSGGVPAGDLDLAGGELVQLPVAMSADAAFSAIHDGEGKPIDDTWRARRKRMLLEVFERRRPGLLLIEMFPFGRRQFAFELEPLMAAAKRLGIPVAISLRDILVTKNKPTRLAETLGLVNRYVDTVLVHGDPAIVRLEATFPAAAQIAPPVIHTGYVADGPAPAAAHVAEGEEILVSAGGGAVGAPLLRAVLAARSATRLADAPWRLIAGPNLPENDFARISGDLPPRTVLERFRRDFPALMAAARLSISQAGYNTIMDILATGSRALVLPFAEGAESEQTLRARLLAGRGLLALMEPPFKPAALARAIDAAADRPRAFGVRVDLDGANATARHVIELMSGRGPAARGSGAGGSGA